MDSSKSEMAFRHVMDGRRIVARQRERLETLARNGQDTTEAKRTFDLFASTLNIFEDEKIWADESKEGGRWAWLVRLAERGFQQTSRVTLTSSCRCNKWRCVGAPRHAHRCLGVF